MTQQRRAPAGGSTQLAPSRGPDRPAPAEVPPALAGGPPPWEEVFQSIPSAQQNQLLSLAKVQGILSPPQLPPLSTAPPAAANRVLTRILSGLTEDLQPVQPPELEILDAALDSAQREAVARAV